MSTITLITGFAGAGKSTVSRLLAQQFSRCLHISVDALREMMVTGQCNPSTAWSEEAYQQFQRARATAIYMAQLNASHGVQVLIDDVCVPYMFAEHYAPLAALPNARRILLMPSRTAVHERIKQRQGPWDHILGNYIAEVYDYLEPMPKAGWIVLDTSDWTVEKTVSEVSTHIGVV
jgi:predicted kinase